jgi:ADP-ribosyl-[dinitrogen reductase] hydrolase
MLVEAGIGDAYGAGFECQSKDFVDKFNNLHYITQKEEPCHMLKPGVYTDDLQMTIGLCEAIISGEEWTPLNLAKRFLECFKRDERRGYSGNFFLFLQNVKSGEEFLEKIKPDSDKSGAAMRATPLGLLHNIDDIRWKCRVQAELTHKTEDGVNSALVSALMTHYFYYKKGPKEDLTAWLQDVTGCSIDGHWRFKRDDGDYDLASWVRVKGWDCVEAAVHAIETSNSMREILKKCISFCGDVDTLGLIAMAAASWAADIGQDLPAHLWDGLENGQFGRDYLVGLESKLLACVGNRK